MIFQVSIGSKSLVSAAYSVRIPITLAPGRTLEIGEGVCFTYEHLHIEIVPERYFYSLTVGQFSAEAEARLWLSKLSAALLWMVLKFRVGLIFESTATDVMLHPEPVTIAPGSLIGDIAQSVGWREVDGFYHTDKTVIRPEHKKLIRGEVGRPTITSGIGLGKVVEALEEGLRYPTPEHGLANHKLRLAFEIYASSFFESSQSARFLTLMTALETLAEPASRPEPMADFVRSFVDQLQRRRDDLVGLCGEPEFKSLLGSLENLREKSISQKIRSLLQTTLTDTPESVHLSNFSKIYRVRSRLVHEGLAVNTEIDAAISTLDILVPALLRSLLFAGNTQGLSSTPP